MSGTSLEQMAQRAAYVMDVTYQTNPDSGASAAENGERNFNDAAMALLLWHVGKKAEALWLQCLAAGAENPDRAIPFGDHGIFAVPGCPEGVFGLAVDMGHHGFATFVTRDRDGAVTRVSAARYRGAAPDGQVGPLPTDPQELVRLAADAHRFASPGDDFDLATLAATAGDKRLPYESLVAEAQMEAMELKSEPAKLIGVSAYTGQYGVLEYVEAWEAAFADFQKPDRDTHTFDIRSYAAAAAFTEAGGRVHGVMAHMADTYRGLGALLAARAFAPVMADSHDVLVEQGFVWGERRLSYGDFDKHVFAIPTPDPRKKAFVHANIDLIAPANRFLVVLTMGEDGTPAQVEAHVVCAPAKSFRDGGPMDASKLARMARYAHVFEDPEAEAPRLTQAEFARRLGAGEALPTPAFHVDLVAGTVSPETLSDRSGLRGYFPYIAMNDKSAAAVLRRGGKAPSGYEATKDFGDEADDLDEGDEHDAAAAPGPR